MVNKKIKNATSIEFDRILFKSKIELTMYKTLKDAGLDPKYEAETFVVMDGFKTSHPYYKKSSKNYTVRPITYTPDFIVKINDLTIFFEVKGFVNDTYPIKKKLFLNYLEKQCINYLFFEVYNKTQLLNAIDIINENQSIIKRS